MARARVGVPGPHPVARRRPGRAFTLIEVMIVVVIIGVVAAAASPTLYEAIRRSRAAGTLDETLTALAVVRDDARGNAVCLRVTPSSTAPIQLQVAEIACAGAAATGTFPARVEVLDANVTALRVRRLVGGTPGADLTAFDLDKDGALSPTTTLQFDLTIAGQPRRLLMYPAAGVLEEVRL